MSRQIPPDTVSPAEGGAQGDIGRRIAQRREELGLTREEAAARAGTAPGYIRYLEEQPTATPGVGVLIRLADVLGTSVAALRGGDADRTPGTRRAARHPELLALDPDECRARLSTHGIGRLALDTPEGPYIGPLNYTVVDGVVFCRTTPGSVPAAADGARVAFEVDHIDEGLRQGWSVLVRGRARAVTDPAEVRRLEELAYSAPWAGGEGLMWLSIDTADISGRRIKVDR
ncbi:helix-turn-helix domain-containing protein [Streptomyces sp. NPDC056785]|uniref:helix-turn-helix domain-containing protein n=1 Tax=Streptomyces sp. NPDC056785 TaxID=3345944 RepID=UPI00367423E4